MRSRGENDAEHEEDRRGNNTGTASNTVDQKPEKEHPKNLADEEGVGQPSRETVRDSTLVSKSMSAEVSAFFIALVPQV